MSCKVVFMKEAERDLDDIEEYLSQFYANTAREFFSRLQDRVLLLESMPYLYPAYDADPFFRRMVVGDYLLFYSIEEERNLVIVHRIFHAARDISRQILERRSYPDAQIEKPGFLDDYSIDTLHKERGLTGTLLPRKGISLT